MLHLSSSSRTWRLPAVPGCRNECHPVGRSYAIVHEAPPQPARRNAAGTHELTSFLKLFRCTVLPPWNAHHVMDVDVNGPWCERIGDAVAWLAASSAGPALQNPFDLVPIGDWTADIRRLILLLQALYPDARGLRDANCLVLPAQAMPPRRSRHRDSLRRRLDSRASASSRIPSVVWRSALARSRG